MVGKNRLHRNGEGYFDPTAFEALKNITRGEKRMIGNQPTSFKRGDIYYIESGNSYGSEQRSGRPAIIVSNDKCNETSPVLEVVYLTTQPKTDLPTHVTIHSTSRTSIAICEQVTSVARERFGNYYGTCNDREMEMLDIALLTSLDLAGGVVTKEVVKEVPKEVIKEVIKEVPVPSEDAGEVVRLKAQLEIVQQMYKDLLRSYAAQDALKGVE